MIPFSVDQFLNVFARYNVTVWPTQIVLYAIALCAISLALQRGRSFSRSIACLLSVLWLWSGIVYHLIFFSRINPAAYLFGALFILQAFLFIYAGVFQKADDIWFCLKLLRDHRRALPRVWAPYLSHAPLPAWA